MTTHTFQLGTQSLLKVVGSVIKLASTDVTLPRINSVLLRRQGDYLTATASDRYVIGICRDRFPVTINATDLPPQDWRFSLSLNDVKALLKLARLAVKEKFPVINFEATELKLTGGWDGEFEALNIEALGNQYPVVNALLWRWIQRVPDTDSIPCAAVYMQRWGQFVDAQKIADKEIGGSNPSRFWGVSDGRFPNWVVKIGRDFVGVVMGCHLGDGETVRQITDVSDWKDMLR